ncbi:DUF378 domain-containing protein [Achromobacter mucicolens]|uniref:DUF378 domain-containing protein n=1 Tax=Achromobacter mucicolens TaxID=1389922 RepID=UPI0007C8301F|nr:DUF378 domain-containing protein [Achromobacter mucicolens]OAE54595.1 DUF378 domain-containing protein [Achromobacter xylosoxidans]PTX06039.1 DUF378 domain-containing protein [Achromobacter mucicolens]
MEISRTEELLAPPDPDEDPPAPESGRAEARRGLSVLDWMALMTVVAGGLNSGLIAAVNLDVVAKILPHAAAARTVYGVIGVAALYCVVMLFRLADELGEPSR